jgi:hypothetical protein
MSNLKAGLLASLILIIICGIIVCYAIYPIISTEILVTLLMVGVMIAIWTIVFKALKR